MVKELDLSGDGEILKLKRTFFKNKRGVGLVGLNYLRVNVL